MAAKKYLSVSLPATVPTKLGPIFITPTEANHLHVSSRNGNNLARTENYLSLRGCEYYVSAHYYRYKDGSFQLGPEFTEAQDSNGKRMRETNAYDRRQSLYISNHAASESARDKLADVITNAVNEWTAANPQIITAANIEHLKNKIETAQGDVENAKKVLNEAEANLKAAKETLRAAEAVRQ